MYLYLFPLIAAILGWLFNLSFLNYLFRRLIPAKAPAVAAAAGQYASDKILNADVLAASLTDPKKLEALKPVIESHIDVFLKEKLKEKMPAIAMFIGDKTIDMIKNSLMDEIDLLLPSLLGKYMGSLGERLNLEKILLAKINELPEGRITALLNQHLQREKRMFRLMGALSGLLIGLVLVAVSLLLPGGA